MHITQLKLLGFKSFVEPTDLLIRPGLTGVVGPNGCGKSNLLEGLRWVMGESSYKAMRAGTMDDVIFSGTQNRPARNNAEVTIIIDNKSRTAPAQFNDEETLEITRHIQREQGSSYRVNGTETRAKDVKLLFEDAATGARSHALVRQGQIGEIVNAKPQARRRILEDAAGIAGLHTRRHEAQLRLNAAQDNLDRIADLIGQMEAQLTSLKRQARHAERYKEISQTLRDLQALHFHLKWQAQEQALIKAQADLTQALQNVAEHTTNEATALTKREALSSALAPLRLAQASTAAALERLNIEQETLTKEEQQALERQETLRAQHAQANTDLTHDRHLIKESEQITARLEIENQEITKALEKLNQTTKEAKETLSQQTTLLEKEETKLSTLQEQVSTQQANKRASEADLAHQTKRAIHFQDRAHSLKQEQEIHECNQGDQTQHRLLTQNIATLVSAIAKLEPEVQNHQEAIEASQTNTATLKDQINDATVKLTALETEISLIEALLQNTADDTTPPVIEAIKTKPGFETALWLALGDDLDVPLEKMAKNKDQTPPPSAFWRTLAANTPPPSLPPGIDSLANYVTGPKALNQALLFIGIVDEADGLHLQQYLQPGQKLVSQSGGLWRWDGFVISPGKPTQLPRRLSERNRLPVLQQERDKLNSQRTKLVSAYEQALELYKAQQETQTTARKNLYQHQQELQQQSQSQRTFIQQQQEQIQKQAALTEGISHAQQEHEICQQLIAQRTKELAQFASLSALTDELNNQQEKVQERRRAQAQAQLNLASCEQEQNNNKKRHQEINRESERWKSQSSQAQTHVKDLEQRIKKADDELAQCANLPQQFLNKRQALLEKTSQAETTRRDAADKLALAETTANDHEKTLRQLQTALIEQRENKARHETRLESAQTEQNNLIQTIEAELKIKPNQCLEQANLDPNKPIPKLTNVEADITRHKQDRERLGAVNLRAAIEIKELEEQFGTMSEERDDLLNAITQLHQAINQLNEEGRQRLLSAFDVVNAHFKKLFQTLFSGGEAELKLIDSDDPLDAGLEIIARPPGKKPQILTLLSGGEKALTAMSLLFAVFLTNPSPICVLDEVDAPLDDTNVDRFCHMLEEMAASTNTRFLVITHHPMTMERMDRLFGVTMSEKGVSQLVSVDLATAENLRDSA